MLTLITLVVIVLSPVFKSILWGLILAILVSPLQNRLLGRYPARANTIACSLVLGAFMTIFSPIIWGLSEIQSEIALAYIRLVDALSEGALDIPDQVRAVPWVGHWLHEKMVSLPRDAQTLFTEFKGLIPMIGKGVGHLVRELTNQAFQLIMIAFSAFFLLRDGAKVLECSRLQVLEIVGPGLNQYLSLIVSTVYAVSFGLLGSAVAQGAVATFGYYLMGLETPLLLGLLSALTSVIPVFGASLVWVPIVVGLLLNDEVRIALSLSAWGILVIHPTDNLLRPLLISHLMHYPISLVILGVVGGVLSFGVVGVFLGPAILAILINLWLEWSCFVDKPGD